MKKTPSEHRIVMARNMAKRWIFAQTHPEHQFTAYYNNRDAKGIPNVLRSFRDSKLKIGSVPAIPDLGVHEDFESCTMWSADRDGLVKLAAWFEEHGYETSGVW